MSTKKNGGAAFPVQGISDGMTLRDWFAGQALADIAGTEQTPAKIAEQAYAIADAMLLARESAK